MNNFKVVLGSLFGSLAILATMFSYPIVVLSAFFGALNYFLNTQAIMMSILVFFGQGFVTAMVLIFVIMFSTIIATYLLEDA